MFQGLNANSKGIFLGLVSTLSNLDFKNFCFKKEEAEYPLHEAIKKEDYKTAKTLLDNGYRADTISSSGDIPVFLALIQVSLYADKLNTLLLQRKRKIRKDRRNERRGYASKTPNSSTFDQTSNCEMSETKNCFSDDTIAKIVNKEVFEVLKMMSKKMNRSLYFTILKNAIFEPKNGTGIQIARLLLQHQIINSQLKHKDRTLLHLAVRHNDLEFAKLILQYQKPKVRNTQDSIINQGRSFCTFSPKTPLVYALTRSKYLPLVKELLRNGARLFSKEGSYFVNPIDVALKQNNYVALKWICHRDHPYFLHELNQSLSPLSLLSHAWRLMTEKNYLPIMKALFDCDEKHYSTQFNIQFSPPVFFSSRLTIHNTVKKYISIRKLELLHIHMRNNNTDDDINNDNDNNLQNNINNNNNNINNQAEMNKVLLVNHLQILSSQNTNMNNMNNMNKKSGEDQRIIPSDCVDEVKIWKLIFRRTLFYHSILSQNFVNIKFDVL